MKRHFSWHTICVSPSNSWIVHSWSVSPAQRAGVAAKVECFRQKLKCAINKAVAAFRYSIFLEKPSVRRVKRRLKMRTLKFVRSTYEVLINAGSGLPLRILTRMPMHGGGEYAARQAHVLRLRPTGVSAPAGLFCYWFILAEFPPPSTPS